MCHISRVSLSQSWSHNQLTGIMLNIGIIFISTVQSVMLLSGDVGETHEDMDDVPDYVVPFSLISRNQRSFYPFASSRLSHRQPPVFNKHKNNHKKIIKKTEVPSKIFSPPEIDYEGFMPVLPDYGIKKLSGKNDRNIKKDKKKDKFEKENLQVLPNSEDLGGIISQDADNEISKKSILQTILQEFDFDSKMPTKVKNVPFPPNEDKLRNDDIIESHIKQKQIKEKQINFMNTFESYQTDQIKEISKSAVDDVNASVSDSSNSYSKGQNFYSNNDIKHVMDKTMMKDAEELYDKEGSYSYPYHYTQKTSTRNHHYIENMENVYPVNSGASHADKNTHKSYSKQNSLDNFKSQDNSARTDNLNYMYDDSNFHSHSTNSLLKAIDSSSIDLYKDSYSPDKDEHYIDLSSLDDYFYIDLPTVNIVQTKLLPTRKKEAQKEFARVSEKRKKDPTSHDIKKFLHPALKLVEKERPMSKIRADRRRGNEFQDFVEEVPTAFHSKIRIKEYQNTENMGKNKSKFENEVVEDDIWMHWEPQKIEI